MTSNDSDAFLGPVEFPKDGHLVEDGGYDKEWFVDIEEPRFEAALLCCICQNVAKMPCRARNDEDHSMTRVMIEHEERCTHVMCWPCLGKYESTFRSEDARDVPTEVVKCPECKRPIEMAGLQHDVTCDRTTAVERVVCKYARGNCKWTGIFGMHGKNMDKHLSTECKAHPVACRFSSLCPPQSPYLQMMHEQDDCPRRPIVCPHCPWSSSEASRLEPHWALECEGTFACPHGCWAYAQTKWQEGRRLKSPPPKPRLMVVSKKKGQQRVQQQRPQSPQPPPSLPSSLWVHPLTCDVSDSNAPKHVQLAPQYTHRAWVAHLTICPCIPTPCAFVKIGCDHVSPRYQAPSHIETQGLLHETLIKLVPQRGAKGGLKPPNPPK